MGIVKYVERKLTWGMKNNRMEIVRMKIVYSIWKIGIVMNSMTGLVL